MPSVSEPRNMTNGGSAVDSKNDFSEIGASGLKRAAGLIFEEFLPELQGENGVRVYKEMSNNDPIVGATLYAIEMFLRKVEWRVKPFDDSDEAQKDADFLRDCMDDMSHTWPDFISEVLTMLPYGWSYFETLYKKRMGMEPGTYTDDDGNEKQYPRSKYDDGKIGWRKFAPRSQDSFRNWVFDEEGGVKALVQQAPPTYVPTPIPIDKSLLFRTTSRKNNPEGYSILRRAYRSWRLKKRIEETEGIGIERDLAGLPVIEVPAEFLSADATPGQKKTVAAMEKMLRNIRRDEQEGVLFPLAYDDNGNKMFNFMLMASGSTRAFNTSEVIERYDKRIAMTTLTDFMFLGQDAVGSYALSVSKVGMFQASLEAVLDNIAAVLNNHAVPRLWKMNGFDLSRMPSIEHDNVQSPSVEDIAAFLSAMSGAGAPLFPDLELENYLRRLLGLPEREEKDSIDNPDENEQIEEQNDRSSIDVTRDSTAEPKAPAAAAAGAPAGPVPEG